MKKGAAAAGVCLLAGCHGLRPKAAIKNTAAFMDTFDTNVIVMAYTSSQAEFDALFDIVQASSSGCRLFDIYHSYSGINNIKTINDNAGIRRSRWTPISSS